METCFEKFVSSYNSYVEENKIIRDFLSALEEVYTERCNDLGNYNRYLDISDFIDDESLIEITNSMEVSKFNHQMMMTGLFLAFFSKLS